MTLDDNLQGWLQVSAPVRRVYEAIPTIHRKMRRDGVTPEYFHIFDVATRISNLPIDQELMEEMLLIALLHDTPEDYGLSVEIMLEMMRGPNPGLNEDYYQSIAQKAWVMSKFDISGERKKTSEYFREIQKDPLLVIVKCADGLSNLLDTMSSSEDPKQARAFAANYCRYVKGNHLKMLRGIGTNADMKMSGLILLQQISDVISNFSVGRQRTE